jgi:flagellar L-ring protein precursor FlgH
MRMSVKWAMLLALSAALANGADGAMKFKGKDKEKASKPSPLDLYVTQSAARASNSPIWEPSPGSLWNPSAPLSDLARDNRASQIDDIVTVQVSEKTSAVANGATKTARSSAANNSITALAGKTSAAGALANLTGLSGSTTLDGQGTTSRGTTLTTNISARVIAVLPNGYLVIDGVKDVQVDSEHQLISVRGVVRPADITTANTVASDRIAEMEVRVNGKGVIGDAMHRPMFLYRLLLGLMPF